MISVDNHDSQKGSLRSRLNGYALSPEARSFEPVVFR
jgi:hypothetical protein